MKGRYRDGILLLVTGLVICGAWIVADVVTPTNRPWGNSHSLHFVVMLSGITFGLMVAHWGICYMWEIYHEKRNGHGRSK